MKKLLIYLSVFMLFIITFGDIVRANTSRHYMRIGRLWAIAEYDGAEGWGGQYAWPGGRVRNPTANARQLWGGNVRKLGTVAGCTNWTGPNGESYAYWTAGCYRTYDYDYLPYWGGKTDLTAVMPVTQELVQRWAPPVVTVDGVVINLSSGDDFVEAHDNNKIDPTLVAERLITSVWRYTMGVEYVRKMYGYSTPNHQDYLLSEITLTNNGKMYGKNVEPPVEWPVPEWPQILEGQKIEGFWWAQVENPWNSSLGRSKSFGADDATGEYIAPFASEGNDRRYYLYYDGDNQDSPEKDWGDPSNSSAANDGFMELLSPAWIIQGALYADKSATEKVDDLNQPNSTCIKQERDYDLGKIPKTMQAQYDALFIPGTHFPLDTPHRDVEANISKPSGYRAYGPYDLDFGQSVRLIKVVAAGGISHELCKEYGRKAFDAGYTGPVMDEIETLHKTGRDSVLKVLDYANWNVNGDKGGREVYDVPDAPRPPANFDVAANGSVIELSWSDESRNDKDFDTGVEDFEGYRLFKAIGARDSVYRLIYDGTGNEFIDEDVFSGFQYFYYLVAYDNGSQNWEEPGVSLESGKYYCWTGWSPTGVTPAIAPITSSGSLDAIRVVPNPYSAAGLKFPGEDDKILFTGLPAECTITIYTSNGDFVHEIEHTDGSGNEPWNLRTKYNQYAVSDVYIYKVDSDLGSYVDKFIIIR
jgi:hypothetical protein